MRLDEATCRALLRSADHGVLGTVHPVRGVDLVPVVYAIDDAGRVFVPVDTVKPKGKRRLQRVENLAADPRCSLLVESYEHNDWSRLWWVRLHGAGRVASTRDLEAFRPLLAVRYPQYADPATIVGGLVIEGSVTGWRAA